MNDFIKIPNLPSKKITSVLVDFRTNINSIKKLNSLGIRVYTTKRHPELYEAVSGHPDMTIHHLGGNKFVVAPDFQDVLSEIPNIEIIVGKSELNSLYPYDIAYNAARVGNFLIHNFKYTDKLILENTEELIKIDVKQGYSKCSVCIVCENAIITSDIGIAKKCDNFGIDVLHVDDSDIVLRGVSHGFIGGSCGLISHNTLAINGNLKYHKNYEEILDFCNKYKVEILELHNGLIKDIGSLICIGE